MLGCAIHADAHRNILQVSSEDRSRLETIISNPSSLQKHVWRCRIVLLSADGAGTTSIMTATGKSKTCVWRWAGAVHGRGCRWPAAGEDAAARTPRTPDEKVAEVIRLTQVTPPHEATHWTIRAMGKGRWSGRFHGAGELEGPWAEPAPLASVQAVERQGLRRETARCGRALRLAARPCGSAIAG